MPLYLVLTKHRFAPKHKHTVRCEVIAVAIAVAVVVSALVTKCYIVVGN